MNKLKFFILMVVLIATDQIVKIFIVMNRANLPKKIIGGVLDFTYCENRGIAFGFASGHVQLFSIMTLIMLLIIVYLVFKYYNKMSGLTAVGVAMLMAGGFGNFIDRAFRTYVVDFIDVGSLFDFPIFNFADICVVLGVVVIGIASIINCRREEAHENNS